MNKLGSMKVLNFPYYVCKSFDISERSIFLKNGNNPHFVKDSNACCICIEEEIGIIQT